MVHVNNRLVREPTVHLAPRELQQGAGGQPGETEALESGDGTAEIADRFVQNRSGFPATGALSPCEAGREAEPCQLIALADLLEDLARLVEVAPGLVQVTRFRAGEPYELQGARLLEFVAEAPRGRERALCEP